ncbi:signal peptidase I [Candidatus Woesebacteria bacterium RBG_13_36_22]|uniref:Signal peptidase I n=1 Tax=Candidatus Woesebacteria bacterium RBG_13_36_22 TaxID=1802478 RepID=A0A1F7X2X2_9BACT|nr:MAG: signal peptidase I [Candidatus Woesebacteria bacterium RBG_13_36_22]
MDKRKIIKKTIGWVLYVGILIGLIIGIPKGLSYVLDSDHPMASITSGSMWPSLKKGDLVFIKGIENKDEIKQGDIIVYKNAKGFTIHRVAQLNEETVVTKGDANNTSDAPVRYEDIVGKTVTYSSNKPIRIPFLGSISILINKSRI